MAWYDTNWPFREKIEVKAENIVGPLVGFPFMLNGDNFDTRLWSRAKADGSDLVVTSADGVTKLPIEVVSFNSGTASMEVWIKCDLSHITDTVLYLYFGNPTATEVNDPTVWSSYIMVHHFENDPSGAAPQMLDSTVNSYNGTVHGGVESFNEYFVSEYLNEVSTTAVAGAHDVDIRGNLAAVVGKAGVFSVIDVSDPYSMTQLGEYTIGIPDAQTVRWLSDNYVFVGADSVAVVLDLSNPNAPYLQTTISGIWSGPLNGCEVSSNDTYLYAANKGASETNGSIEIFNISDPSLVTHVTSYSDPDGDSPHDVGLTSDDSVLVYVCKGPSDVKQVAALDLTLPTAPSMLSTVTDTQLLGANQLKINNDSEVYVVCNYTTSYNLGVIDISTPATISKIGLLTGFFEPDGIFLDGNYAYIANSILNGNGTGELTVVDITTPTTPVVVQRFERGELDGGHAMFKKDGFLFVAAGGEGVRYLQSFVSLRVGSTTGKGLVFKDSSSSYVSTGATSIPTSSNIVIQGRVNVNKVDSVERRIVSKDPSGTPGQFQLKITTIGSIYFAVRNSTDTAWLSIEYALPVLDKFFDLEAHWDNTNGRLALYVNGNMAVELTGLESNTKATSDAIVIGADSSGVAYFFDGMLDEVRVGTVVRPQYEILTEHRNMTDPKNFYRVVPEDTLYRFNGTDWLPIQFIDRFTADGWIRVGTN